MLAHSFSVEAQGADAREVGGEHGRRDLLRLAVDPDGALAVLRGVVDALHEVPGDGLSVLREADSGGPGPLGVARVVRRRVVDHSSCLERAGLAADRDGPARTHASLLARPGVARAA